MAWLVGRASLLEHVMETATAEQKPELELALCLFHPAGGRQRKLVRIVSSETAYDILQSWPVFQEWWPYAELSHANPHLT